MILPKPSGLPGQIQMGPISVVILSDRDVLLSESCQIATHVDCCLRLINQFRCNGLKHLKIVHKHLICTRSKSLQLQSMSNNEFEVYPFCHASQFFRIYDSLFGADEACRKFQQIPTTFMRSSTATSLCVTITYNLWNARTALNAPVINLDGVLNWGSDVPMELPQTDHFLDLNTQYNQTNRVYLLKSAGMDILRFVSQLTDMYNDKDYTNSNKSLASLLGQERLRMEEADVISEIRHQLTHKSYPSQVAIIAAIDYLLGYLKKEFWDVLYNELIIFKPNDKKSMGKVRKSIRKQMKSKEISNSNFIIHSRQYLKDQLKDLYKEKDPKSKMEEYISYLVKQINSDFECDHICSFLLSQLIRQAGFSQDVLNQDPKIVIKQRISGQSKQPITTAYIETLVKQSKIMKLLNQKNSQLKRTRILIRRCQFINTSNEYVGRVCDSFKMMGFEEVLRPLDMKETLSQNNLENLEYSIESTEREKLIGEIYFKYIQEGGSV